MGPQWLFVPCCCCCCCCCWLITAYCFGDHLPMQRCGYMLIQLKHLEVQNSYDFLRKADGTPTKWGSIVSIQVLPTKTPSQLHQFFSGTCSLTNQWPWMMVFSYGTLSSLKNRRWLPTPGGCGSVPWLQFFKQLLRMLVVESEDPRS